MKPGQVTRPILLETGYHIVLLLGRRTSPGLGEEKVTLTLTQAFLPLSRDANGSQVFAAKQRLGSVTRSSRTCEDLEKAGKAAGSDMSGSLGKIRLKKLPAHIRGVVADLPENTPSRAIRAPAGIQVLMVCERKVIKPDPSRKREEVRQSIMAERLSNIARRHLRDLRRAAYVDTRM